jgi:ABC-type nickel/cobalt efflux system permease component RcnA
VRRLTAVLVALGAAVLLAAPVAAHPLGNFSISRYTAIHLDERSVELRYVVDLAEIPTFQELQAQGVVADPAHPGALAYAARKADALRAGLHLEVAGQAMTLERHAVEILFPPGAGGLPTLKLGARYRATLPSPRGTAALSYRDENYPDRAGWKEVILTAGSGVTLVVSSVPEQDRSQALADYPTDLLDSPPQDTAAHALFTRDGVVVAEVPSAPAAGDRALRPNRQAAGDVGLPQLLQATSGELGVVLFALAVAAGLGALHALEPGHGKTMVAAYLVGSRGTAWHAVVLGVVVTASHTAAVYALGAATLYASHYVVPERIYPWLAVATGVTIAALGLYLLGQRSRGELARGHDDHHDGGHHHHGHEHGHDHGHHQLHGHHHAHGHHQHDTVSLKQLFALGVTGGIVPCPAALVVLLGAVSLGRIGFGLVLIVAFSAGLAAVLIATGLLVIHARRILLRASGEGRMVTRWLPLTSAALITLVGVAMTIRALAAVVPGGAAS